MKKKYRILLFSALAVVLTVSVFATKDYFSYNDIKEKENYVASNSVPALPDEYFDTDKVFTDSDVRQPIAMPKAKANDTLESKEYIFDKMLNSIDNFTSVQGEYTRYEGSPADVDTLQYSVDLTQTQKSAITKLTKEQSYTSFFDNGKIYDFTSATNNNAKANNDLTLQFESNYNIDKSARQINDVKSTSRIKTLPNGEKVYYYRSDNVLLGEANGSLFAQEMAMGFLSDFSQWKIIKEDNYAKEKCFVIEGALTGDYAEKTGVSTFVMYVDSATGVLLKYEGNNADGKAVSGIDTSFIQYNTPIDSAIFAPYEAAIKNK